MIRSAFAPQILPSSGVALFCNTTCRHSARVSFRRKEPIRYLRYSVPICRIESQDITEMPSISTESVGKENTPEYRLYFKTAGGLVSPWHDIPLYPNIANKKIVNFINEIPKGTQEKMEIATDESRTPIKQDIKNGALRVYKYGPSLVNYGAFPQTWEDPSSVIPDLRCGGDNDPLDVTEIGEKVMPFGAVYPVKVLGCLALLDEGEVDWKIIAINVDDPNASRLDDIDDVEKVMPGKIDEVRNWFRMYKTAEGKGENEYGYNGEARGAEFAMKVIEETNESYRDLKNGSIPNGALSMK